MTEYKPTTGDVREFYHGGRITCDNPPGMNERNAEFDRWLAAHDAEVAANALRDAASVLYSEEQAQWALDAKRVFGSQMIAQHLGVLRKLITARADRIEREATNHNSNGGIGEGCDA